MNRGARRAAAGRRRRTLTEYALLGPGGASQNSGTPEAPARVHSRPKAASAGGSDAEKSNGCGLAGIKPDQAGLATIAWGCQGRQTIKVPGEPFQLLETFRRGDRRLRPWKAESVLEWRCQEPSWVENIELCGKEAA